MLETPHVVVGAAIATKIGNPLLAIPLAFVSHFLLEKVPHWNPHISTEKKKYGKVTRQSTIIIIVDVMLSLAMGSAIALQNLPDLALVTTVYLASFAAVLPDVIEAPYFFLNMKSKFLEKWAAFQKSLQVDAPIAPGLATQLITIIATFWWIAN